MGSPRTYAYFRYSRYICCTASTTIARMKPVYEKKEVGEWVGGWDGGVVSGDVGWW